MVQKIRKAKPKQKQEKAEKNKLSKFIKKKPKQSSLTKRDNAYVFEGFYEKLKQIDVKQSNYLEANFIFDNVLRQQDRGDSRLEEEDEIFNSNFIQFLRNERGNNKTLEFGKLYKIIEPFCFSYPLLVHNKPKIIELLISFLTSTNQNQENAPVTIQAIQVTVLDMIVALIKDFRSEIYQEFKQKILPSVISEIDMQRVQILDKVFTVISFGIKYLSKSIKDDIENFYELYFELLVHKNRYIRKFASQSISYVLRKINFSQKVIEMIFNQLLLKDNEDIEMIEDDNRHKIEDTLKVNDQALNKIQGISDLIFEVIYGAGEGLHSKFNEVIDQVFIYYKEQNQSKEIVIVIRCLFLKIANEVDTEKQQPIYESLNMNLDYKNNEQSLKLLLLIFKDLIRLKYGKRITNLGIIQMMQIFNQIFVKNIKKSQEYSLTTKVNIVETLSLLYYFKHQNVINVLTKSQLDLNTSNNIFNKYIFNILKSNEQKDSVIILQSYFRIFIENHSEITAYGDIDWAKILGLKQSQNNQIEFSKDSHQNKVRPLVKPLNKYLLKQIQKEQSEANILQIIAIFLLLIQSNNNESYLIQLNDEIENKIILLLKQTKNLDSKYILIKFISLCTGGKELAIYLKSLIINTNSKKDQKKILDDQDIDQNLILKNYGLSPISKQQLNNAIGSLFDLTNLGTIEQIEFQLQPMSLIYINRCLKDNTMNTNQILQNLEENPSDIVIIRSLNQNIIDPIDIAQHEKLFKKVSMNLLKNQNQLRLQSLRLLNKFNFLDYLKPNEDENNIDESKYLGKCIILEFMLQFQQIENSFEKEKTKMLLIKKIQTLLESGLIPDIYLEATFNFLIGSFWIKFTPLFDSIQEALAQLIKLSPERFGGKVLFLIENAGYISQIAHDNEDLMQKLIKSQNIKINSKSDDLVQKCILKESKLDDEYMEVKDLYYNLTKTIQITIDNILDDQNLRNQLFGLFYSFKDHEYALIYQFKQSQNSNSSILDQMTYANMIDSESYVKFRRQTYSKLYCFIEIFYKADNLGKIPKREEFQQLMFRLLNTSDTKLQKLALDCLIKSDYKNGVLRQYRKMLEGFTDDEKFKDMIQTLTFGSSIASGDANMDEVDAPKKLEKGTIPKLADKHRIDVLPVVIKLLISKLIKKKGSINKKTLYTRRNIIYQFISTFDKQEELEIFFNELLEPLGLAINQQFDYKLIQNSIAQVSFSGYLNFISSLNIIIKQLGSLLQNYLPQICHVLTCIITLTKLFIKQLKITFVEDKEKEIKINENEDNQNQIKDQLYKFVGNQSKLCLRKSLGVSIQLFSKFSNNEDFINLFSNQIYEEIIKDQLELFQTNYISDKSQLIEIITLQWSSNQYQLQNFIKYTDILPSLMKMMSQTKINSEVYELIFQLLKTLISKSIQGLEEKKDLFNLGQQLEQDENEEDLNMEQENENEVKERQLKQALVFKNKQKKKNNQLMALGGRTNIHETKQQSIKDLIFIISEITNYLQIRDPLNQSNLSISQFLEFLELTVQIISLQQLHKDSLHNLFAEELLLFGVKSLIQLLQKTSENSIIQMDKIFQLFLSIKSLKVREILSNGLATSEIIYQDSSEEVRKEVKVRIASLNKIKKGFADAQLDYDLVIKTIEKLGENKFQDFNINEIRAITFNILFLLQSEEFSVRDYSSHLIKELFAFIKDQQNQDRFNSLLAIIETTLINQIKITHDEMILKTILETLRYFIYHITNSPYKSPYNLQTLSSLIQIQSQTDNQEQAEPEDFFTKYLSIKLKTRAKALQLLTQKLSQNQDQQIDFKAIQAVVMPLLNHIIFGAKELKQQRRGMISYNKEEKRQIFDEAMNSYQAIAKLLKWSDYYKMMKTLLFKLNKISNKVNQSLISGSSKEEGSDRQMERVITKCICKILDGFHFEQVPDAIKSNKDLLEKQEEQLISSNQQEIDTNKEFQQLIKQIVKADDNSPDNDEEELSDNEEEIKQIEKEQDITFQQQEQQLIDIQDKLLHKVLPILERHLTDYEDHEQDKTIKDNQSSFIQSSGSIRSFVVLSIAKTIRKLPFDQFQNQLSKLINSIITKGLRSRQLVHREKARKALVKLLQEVNPRYHLYQVFQMMDDLLTRGYQLQTYIFTIMYLLQQLNQKGLLEIGMINKKIIDLTSNKLMDELFGELTQSEKQNIVEDSQKNQIKEAKGKKAVAIFELYSQFIDFNQTFFTLLSPILHSLEGNPSIGKVQQCEELLYRLATSLIKNKSVKGDQLMLFLYSVIEKGVKMSARIKINDDKSTSRDYGKKAQKSEMFLKTKEEYKDMTYKVEMKWYKGNQMLGDKKAEEISGRVMASFGLMCLKKALKNKGLILSNISDAKDKDLVEDLTIQKEQIKEELKAKLDPFVPILLDAFKTYHNPIVVSTLHILGMIINLGLPSFKTLMKKFLNRLFKLFEQTVNSQSDTDFINSLFKCTAELIKSYSTFNDLTEGQLKMLCNIIKQNLSSQNNPSQINVFHLLRALIYRKFISPDLYDIIDQHVQDQLMTSLSPTIRALCSTIFLNFLLDYPLEEQRLNQHLNFLIKNMGSYFDYEGRLQILEVMEKISEKMPKEIMDQQAEKWVFALMIRTVNENHKKCLIKVSNVLKKLLQKISANKSKTILNTLLSMSNSNQDSTKKQALLSAKLQLIGIFITAIPQLLKQQNILEQVWIDECYLVISEESHKLSKKAKKNKDDEDDDDFMEIQNPEMKRFLENIELVEKQDPDNGTAKTIQMIDDESQDKDKWAALYYALENIHKLLAVEELNKHQVQLINKSQNFIKNLMTLSAYHHVYWIKLVIQKIIETLLGQPRQANIMILTTLGFNEASEFQNLAFQQLNQIKALPMTPELGKTIVKNLIQIIKECLSNQQLKQQFNLIQLYKKASFVGRKLMLNISFAQERLEWLLNFFKDSLSLFESLSQSQKDNPHTRSVCESILELVYRLYTDDQYLPQSPVKTLSYEIVDYFSANIDKSFFLGLYNQVKTSITEKRLERKRKHKVMMVSNQAQWEKVKEKDRMKKREKKKSKKREEKIQMALRKT